MSRYSEPVNHDDQHFGKRTASVVAAGTATMTTTSAVYNI